MQFYRELEDSKLTDTIEFCGPTKSGCQQAAIVALSQPPDDAIFEMNRCKPTERLVRAEFRSIENVFT